jgi:hypothetical protein
MDIVGSILILSIVFGILVPASVLIWDGVIKIMREK